MALNGRSSYPDSPILQNPFANYLTLAFVHWAELGVNMKNITINQPVHVTALGFKKNLRAYPRQIEFEGRTYDFVDAGLSCLVNSGRKASQILTMSDGRSQFRLRSDNYGGLWTLLSMSA